jgi:hypothetical protein
MFEVLFRIKNVIKMDFKTKHELYFTYNKKILNSNLKVCDDGVLLE